MNDCARTVPGYTIHAASTAGPAPDPAPGTGDWAYACARDLLSCLVDEAISRQLAAMGEAAGVDRAWLLEYSEDMLRFRNTHEWCRGQTSPYVAELQEAPVTLIAWLHKYMMQGQAVAVADVTELPRTARAIQVEFLRQGNKSVLSVPLLRDGKPRGIIGFDTTERHRAWTADEVDALFRCAGLIALAKYAGPARDQPQHQPSSPHHTLDTRSPALIYLSMRGVVRGVQPESIVGVRSAGNYSEIWLDSGAMVLDSRALGLWSTLLPERIFFRIHRSAIINALHVLDVDRRSVDRWQIRMRSADRSWSVSRSYRQHLRERMGI